MEVRELRGQPFSMTTTVFGNGLTTRFPWSIWAAVGSWRRRSSYTSSSLSRFTCSGYQGSLSAVRAFVVSPDCSAEVGESLRTVQETPRPPGPSGRRGLVRLSHDRLPTCCRDSLVQQRVDLGKGDDALPTIAGPAHGTKVARHGAQR